MLEIFAVWQQWNVSYDISMSFWNMQNNVRTSRLMQTFISFSWMITRNSWHFVFLSIVFCRIFKIWRFQSQLVDFLQNFEGSIWSRWCKVKLWNLCSAHKSSLSSSRFLPDQTIKSSSGVHKSFHPTIRDGSTWSKFEAHGEPNSENRALVLGEPCSGS